MRPFLATFLFLLLQLLLAGCKDLVMQSPTDVDLTGTWVLDRAHSDAGAVHEHPAPLDVDERPTSNPRGHSPLPRLPMLTAEEMTIDQDATSMGIAYPNQPYRDLKWGEQKHNLYRVQSGWDNGRLIVETKSTPMHIKETYTLSDDRNTLTLRVDVDGRAIDSAHFVRVFTRKSTV